MILVMSLQFWLCFLLPLLHCMLFRVSMRRCVSVCTFFALAYGTYNICYEVFMAPFQIVPLILSPLVVLSCAFSMQSVSVTNIEIPSWRPKEMCRPLCMHLILKNERFFIRRQLMFCCFFPHFFIFLHLFWQFTIFVCVIFSLYFCIFLHRHNLSLWPFFFSSFFTLAIFCIILLTPILCSHTFIRWILFGARIT